VGESADNDSTRARFASIIVMARLFLVLKACPQNDVTKLQFEDKKMLHQSRLQSSLGRARLVR
jgi:hypothetical protein